MLSCPMVIYLFWKDNPPRELFETKSIWFYNLWMPHIKDQFLLAPDIVFLNHGSFGATPKPVMEAYQNWQVRLENQPVQFLGREINDLLLEARQELGLYLNAAADILFSFQMLHMEQISLLNPGI